MNVHMERFTGTYDQVWIPRDDWTSFLSSLAQLERDRRGQATLRSTSPDEFELRLGIIDRAGHLAASGDLSRHHFAHPSGHSTSSRIAYHLSLDPSLLRELTHAFTALEPSTDGTA